MNRRHFLKTLVFGAALVTLNANRTVRGVKALARAAADGPKTWITQRAYNVPIGSVVYRDRMGLPQRVDEKTRGLAVGYIKRISPDGHTAYIDLFTDDTEYRRQLTEVLASAGGRDLGIGWA